MVGSRATEARKARALRNTLTPHEVILWSGLKRLRREGYHFRRQAPFRGYFLDFVCFSRKLVVEADGSQHGTAEGLAHDRARDAVLAREGFLVLRFSNGYIERELGTVMDAVLEALAGRRVSEEG